MKWASGASTESVPPLRQVEPTAGGKRGEAFRGLQITPSYNFNSCQYGEAGGLFNVGLVDVCKRFHRALAASKALLASTLMESESSPQSRTKILVTWGLRILVALIFLTPALLTLWGHRIMVRQFDALGFAPWMRVALSSTQVLAALLVLVPVASLAAAVLLLLIDAGTLIAQFLLIRGGYVHLALFALPLLALISLQSGRFDRKLAELEK